MTIDQVKKGLQEGKKFRRIETLEHGDRCEETVSPLGQNTFRHVIRFRSDDPNGFGGGVADLSIDILPGRWEAKGWREIKKK